MGHGMVILVVFTPTKGCKPVASVSRWKPMHRRYTRFLTMTSTVAAYRLIAHICWTDAIVNTFLMILQANC